MVTPTCECGCGLPVTIANYSRKDRGIVAGQYVRFIRGHTAHAPHRPVDERFWSKVNKTETCWLWTAALDRHGYGVFGVAKGRGSARAHRVAYELVNGPIPGSLPLDHLCRVRACVNPAHLEPVTVAENNRRMMSARRTGAST